MAPVRDLKQKHYLTLYRVIITNKSFIYSYLLLFRFLRHVILTSIKQLSAPERELQWCYEVTIATASSTVPIFDTA